MHIIINKNYLTYKKFKVKCAIGKNGIGNKKIEGDLITPKGQFNIKYVLYRKDRVKNIRTNLRKIIIKKNMGWCNDPKSKLYNKLVYLPFDYNYEKMFKKDNVYDIVLVLNYNMKPTKKNKGSAIFIHVAKRKFNKTEGCVAINKIKLLEIIKDVSEKTKVMILDQK